MSVEPDFGVAKFVKRLLLSFTNPETKQVMISADKQGRVVVEQADERRWELFPVTGINFRPIAMHLRQVANLAPEGNHLAEIREVRIKQLEVPLLVLFRACEILILRQE